MKKNILFLSLITLVALLSACSADPGCKIQGFAQDKGFEGKTVFLLDPLNDDKVCDSTVVKQGKFTFSDPKNIDAPYVRVISVSEDNTGLASRLPVVFENGEVEAVMGDVVCTSGTDLNDKMQDFLLAVNKLSATMMLDENCTVDQIKGKFAAFLKENITEHADNIIGVYICKAYQSSLTEADLQPLLANNEWLRKQLEK